MPSITSTIASAVSKTASSVASTSTAARAAEQAGILSHGNPTVYDPKNPIILFIIQAGIIIIFCRLLHYPLSYLRQPRVISEVLGGIILGPSVLMRIPGFQKTIFPSAATPGLSLVANLGLVLFLFLVGLEVNIGMFMSNWRVAVSVGLAGMILPFGLGCGIAWGLFNAFHNDGTTVPISFGIYALFIGTALSITAFPVLCRILTELKLLSTTVGITVLAAGVGNDVTGWILLALCVALVNNGSGLVALYVLLTAIAWILFLVYAVRPSFIWLLRRTGSLHNGPTQSMVGLTLLLVLTSAWFTGIIGIHPIFGAFLVGIICPHEGGFAIKVTEKLEDLVSVLLLPLYFALSGLSTNLGLLDSGETWGYVVGVIAVAVGGKVIGGTLAAKGCKLEWRESMSIGVLMSCKGLVELIVLNIGLQAKILSTRTFTIFVVMALVTTVMTTPLAMWLYPPAYQQKLEAKKRGELEWNGDNLAPDSFKVANGSESSFEKLQGNEVKRLLVYLRLNSLPSLFTFIALLGGDRSSVSTKVHRSKAKLEDVKEKDESEVSVSVVPKRPLEVHGLRMLELTDRTSSLMKINEIDDYSGRDPVVNAFRTFAQLNNVAVSGGVSVVPESYYAETLTSQASDHLSDLVLIPWSDDSDGVLGIDSLASGMQEAFIQKTLETATCNTAVFFNRGFGGVHNIENRPVSRSSRHAANHQIPLSQPFVDRSHHIYFPFFGGADDRVALRFVLQLAQNPNITATVIHFRMSASAAAAVGPKRSVSVLINEARASSNSFRGSSSKLAIESMSPEAQKTSAAKDTALLHLARDCLSPDMGSRVMFTEAPTSAPIDDCLTQARKEIGHSLRNAGDLIVVGRSRHPLLVDAHEHVGNADLRKTLGVVAETMISAGVRGSVLVMQAGGRGLDQ